MPVVEITSGIHYIGVLHPDLKLFDLAMPLEKGTSYNSYLIKGEKIAVIDTAKHLKCDEFINNIKQVVDPAEIDYIVLNHMELDHSGSARELLAVAPNAKIVFSKTGGFFFKGNFPGIDRETMPMGDGDTLDLGGKTLRFISAPFLHWPDTMFTYVEEDSVLLTCDAFGCHVSCDKIFNDHAGDCEEDFRVYYDVIMRVYRDKVFEAVEKIKDLDIKIIGPSHGPILRENPLYYVDKYREWATPEDKQGKKWLTVIYASMYGSTKRMAEAIVEGAQRDDVLVKAFELPYDNLSDIKDFLQEADGLLLGASTMCSGLTIPIWSFLPHLTLLQLKNLPCSIFGSYGWAATAPKLLEGVLTSINLKIAKPPLTANFVPDENDLEASKVFGKEFAELLVGSGGCCCKKPCE